MVSSDQNQTSHLKKEKRLRSSATVVKVFTVWEMLRPPCPVMCYVHPARPSEGAEKVIEDEGDRCCELSFCAGWPPPHESGRVV